jgi:hypothetical protein
MKTKKTKRLSFIYMIGFIIVLSASLYASFNSLISELWIWIGFVAVTALLFYSLHRRLKKLLFLDFQRHLQLKVQNKNWPIEMAFPMKEQIEVWIDEYGRSIHGVISDHIWSNITEGNTFQHWVKILEKVSVPVIGVNGGISLFDLYYLTSIHVDNADVNSTSSCYELEKTSAFLEYMSVQDLTVYVHPPIHLTVSSLYYLMIRDEKVGDFNEVCLSLMKSNCEIIAPMDVIDYLISDTQGSVSVVFPQRFLAYLIKMEVENRFNLKSDPEKRKKVFDWYMSQSVQEFDFYTYWPKFTEEELAYVLSTFEGEHVRDEIFVAQQDWEHVSTDRLKVMYKPFINNWRTQCPDALLLEVLNRF